VKLCEAVWTEGTRQTSLEGTAWTRLESNFLAHDQKHFDDQKVSRLHKFVAIHYELSHSWWSRKGCGGLQ